MFDIVRAGLVLVAGVMMGWAALSGNLSSGSAVAAFSVMAICVFAAGAWELVAALKRRREP